MCQHSESDLIARCYLHIATVLYYLFDSRIKTNSIFIIRNCDLVTCRYNYTYTQVGINFCWPCEAPLMAVWERKRDKLLNCRAGLHISGRYNRCGTGGLKLQKRLIVIRRVMVMFSTLAATADSCIILAQWPWLPRDSCTVLRADTGSARP